MKHRSSFLSGFALGAVLLWSALSAHAQLGESEQAIRHRLGAPTATEKDSTAEKSLTFERPGVMTVVQLREGTCVSVAVTKIGESLSPTELQEILHANAQGQSWTHDPQAPEVWRRSDGAIAYAETGFVSIVTPQQEKRSSGVDLNGPAGPAGGKVGQ